MDLTKHHCPIRKVLSTNLIEVWARIQDTTNQSPTCFACGAKHYINKNINGFRRFWNVDLCCDCYNIPEITRHVQDLRQQLLELDAHCNKWMCALCEIPLFDPVTFVSKRSFERDHLDVFAKTTTVWRLIVTGCSMHQIKTENDKCRNLCVRCHSAVTYAERVVGILQLKNKPRKQPLSEYVKKRARHQVETLTKMLLTL
jgi:hypothetical protein